jgi:hypothetical protein
MKKIIYVMMTAVVLFGCAKTEKATTGNIIGTVSDKTTGDLVPVVNVSLSPSGKSGVTGSDGSYSFLDLEEGVYTVSINKEGYKPATKSITVVAGQNADGHIVIERIPAIVTVDRDVLDFGENASVNTLSFSIVNSSYEDLIWYIEQNCPWIKEVKPTGGTLKFSKTEPVTVIIDREKLSGGDNETVIVVKSSNGRSELTVKAVGVEKQLAGVTTQDATNITAVTAQLNGTITADGQPPYTERGFVYATTTQPTLEKTIRKITAPVNSIAVFYADVEGLDLNTVYYVRAYATNDIGVEYGNEISFTAKALPSLNTLSVSDIVSTTAKFNAIITSTGSPAYTERGFVFATTSQPTLSTTIRKITAVTNSNESYSADVNGLSLNTTYYVRAYATNSEGTAYGNEVSFISGVELATLTTKTATNITTTSAVLGGSILAAGTPAYTERGVCYGTSSMLTIDNNNKVIIAGTGSETGDFTQQVSGLSSGTKYYVRAYAKSGNSGIAYGEEISFITYAPVSVNTLSVATSDITTSTAKVYGNIVNAGVPAYTEKGICYSTSNNPTIENSYKLSVAGNGTGSYSATINDLSAYTTYYARAYAINELGTVYGNTVNFKTKIEKATVSTQAVTTISGSQVRLNGTIVTVGNPAYTERGFVYGMNSSPTVSDTKVVVAGQDADSFSYIVSYGNNYIYSYHVRAYVINADGSVSYGEDQLFFFEVLF